MKHMESARRAWCLYLVGIGTLAIVGSAGCASSTRGPVELGELPEERKIHLCSIDDDVAEATIIVGMDYTGGQIRSAMEKALMQGGKMEVTIDASKIPHTPTPLLITARLSPGGRSGIYRGKDKIGEILGVNTCPPDWTLWMRVRLDQPVYYLYDDLDRIRQPSGPCGPYFTGITIPEKERCGLSGHWTLFVDPVDGCLRPLPPGNRNWRE
jgi:hypothetical protein